MILYKYYPSARSKVLIDPLIRFTQPDCFNDAFEVTPYIESLIEEKSIPGFKAQIINQVSLESVVKKSTEDTINNLLEEIKLPADAIALLKSISKDDTILKQGLETAFTLFDDLIKLNFDGVKESYQDNFRNILNERFGILCLTEKPDNKRMWSLYADSHKGFVIGFDTNHPFFNQKRSEHDQTGYLRKVIYQKERPRISIYDPSLSETEALNNLATNIFFKKGTDWSYEREWRMIKQLNEADQIIPNESGSIHLFKFPFQCVDRVIIGAKCSSEFKENFLQMLNEHPELSHVKRFQASLATKTYKVNIRKV